MIVHANGYAQALDAGVDISGIYVAEEIYALPETYALTAEAERALSAYDPFAGDPSQYDCLMENMPQVILWGTSIVEITQRADSILMQIERGATTRTIHMDGSAPAQDQAHTPLGHSVGHWEGGVLTIVTTHLDGGILFADSGHPISSQGRTTERYWRDPGEQSLHMELTVEDPVNYTEPVVIEREWIWSPEEQVHPYNCFSLELDESGPVDMEELKRRLNQL